GSRERVSEHGWGAVARFPAVPLFGHRAAGAVGSGGEGGRGDRGGRGARLRLRLAAGEDRGDRPYRGRGAGAGPAGPGRGPRGGGRHGAAVPPLGGARSEERRVGKEGRAGWACGGESAQWV